MVREPWDYDQKSHQVILNVRRDKYGRQKRRKTNSTNSSLLNRPRVVVLTVLLVVLVFTFIREARYVLATNSQFKIQHVQIENTELLDEAVLIQLLNLKETDNLFSVSAKELSGRLMKDPDIESIVVEKKFPNTLRIIVNERIPYVRVIPGNNEYLVDNNGMVLLRKWGGVSVPLVLGVEKDKMIPGEPCCDGILESALEIFRIGDKREWGRFIEVAEMDMRDLNKILVTTRERILLIMKLDDINSQIEKLMLVLADSERRRKIIRKVDLRYKDVYVQ